MSSSTAAALIGYIAWSLALLVLMEALRTKLVLTGRVAANAFTPDNAKLSPFMQRLARAHANCLEGFPIFGGLMLAALALGRAYVTDPLAFILLAARVLQSSIHLASTSPAAVTIRFCFFAVQMLIAAWWCLALAMS
ncbi:MAG: MAPEG family protein [Hyphomicrobiales bacterium]|nr:MAG: MAPEG family protein [Hyphomicrobiales bacterium]